MNLYLVKSLENDTIVELVAADTGAMAENIVAEAHGLDVGHRLKTTLKRKWYRGVGIMSDRLKGEQWTDLWE